MQVLRNPCYCTLYQFVQKDKVNSKALTRARHSCFYLLGEQPPCLVSGWLLSLLVKTPLNNAPFDHQMERYVSWEAGRRDWREGGRVPSAWCGCGSTEDGPLALDGTPSSTGVRGNGWMAIRNMHFKRCNSLGEMIGPVAQPWASVLCRLGV